MMMMMICAVETADKAQNHEDSEPAEDRTEKGRQIFADFTQT